MHDDYELDKLLKQDHLQPEDFLPVRTVKAIRSKLSKAEIAKQYDEDPMAIYQ